MITSRSRCPVCHKAHRKYPEICFSLASNEVAHVVITRVASGAAYQPSEQHLQIETKLKQMEQYCQRWQHIRK